MFGRLRKRLFGISPTETTFVRRGFHAHGVQAREYLERIGETFLQGYHTALETDDLHILAQELDTIEPTLRGFAYEGAAMSLTLLDHLIPWRNPRLQSFLNGPGVAHVYMIHVGAGWALARLPWRSHWPPRWLDPLLRWLAVDGYGFHQGYFDWQRYVRAQVKPKGLSDYACRVFDQGLGRSLWFVEGAYVAKIPHTIAAFSPPRHADLWSGVGLACAYAGGVDASAIATLRTAAGSFQSCLAQGAAFAAKARQHANNPASHTALACEILCNLSVDAAAHVTDVALANLPLDDGASSQDPAYEVWRQRIQVQFAHEEVLP
jgi:hypothetical protein